MSTALRQPIDLEAFLAWEERQALRYEFDGVQPRAMTGGTAAHAFIQLNLLVALGTRLRGRPCRPVGSELKIQAAGSVRYPDAFVVCTPVASSATLVTDPVAVFEVLSESSQNIDLVVKNAEYRATPSIQHYAVLQQGAPFAVLFSRDGPSWGAAMVSGLDATLALPAIGVELPLAEIYEGVVFPAEAEER